MAVGAKVVLAEGSQPITPAAGTVTLYADTDGKRYSLDSAGKRRQIDQDQLAGVNGNKMTYFNSINGYYTPGSNQTAFVSVFGADTPLEQSVFLPLGATIDTASLRIQVAGTSNPTGFVAIYSEDGQTKLLALDSLDWSTTGTKTYSFTEVTISPGFIHVVFSAKDAGVQVYGNERNGARVGFRADDQGSVPAGTVIAPATRTVPKNPGNARMAAISFYKNEP